jgi:type II pantothenate kinase
MTRGSKVIDFSEVRGRYAAIDFGASNTDLLAVVDGRTVTATQAQRGAPTVASVRSLMAEAGVDLAGLGLVAVSGGHHRALPDSIDRTRVVRVGELDAIGRGGQALTTGAITRPGRDLLVVSAGSGRAMVAARGRRYSHVTGTGVGGGTMLGLGRLLLNTMDPEAINALALAGDPNGADLAISDVVSGPIGSLPPDATAVNFGRVSRMSATPDNNDLAAALVTMVAQVIATLAINAARAARVDHIVVTGHLTDMVSMRAAMARVGEFFGMPLELHERAGHATVLGALLWALDR